MGCRFSAWLWRCVGVPLLAIVCSFAASAASAQTIDPRYLQFSASPDHYAMTASNQPLVTGYQMAWYRVGLSSPDTVFDLGKPAPDASGNVTIDLNTVLTTPPASGIVYDARVVAVGPTGSGASVDSNTFVFNGPCTYQVSPTNVSAVAAGGGGIISVTAGSTCAWSDATQAGWLAFNAANGTGSGGVTLSIAANPTTQARTATATVAGITITVNQAAAPCTFSVSPTSFTAPAGGGGATMSVSTLSGCAWTASPGASWLTVGTTSGSGAQILGYSAAANSTGSTRNATLSVAGQTITVTQPAQPVCSYALSAATASFNSFSNTSSVAVNTGSPCAWTAASTASWLTVNQPSGTGPATVAYTVGRNTGGLRTAYITIGGQTLTVTQAAKATGKH